MSARDAAVEKLAHRYVPEPEKTRQVPLHTEEQLRAARVVDAIIGYTKPMGSITPFEARALSVSGNYTRIAGSPFNTTQGPCARCGTQIERYGDKAQGTLCAECKPNTTQERTHVRPVH